MQGRIVELIGRVNHDEITAELLRLNDELNNLFLRHQRYEKNRDPQNSTTPSAILGAALGVSSTGNGNWNCCNDNILSDVIITKIFRWQAKGFID